MIPPAFEYLRPKTIPEAIAFLQQYGDDAKILSGGQSLIPMMKFRIARPGYLIDINRIAGLSYIKEEDGYLKIGGLTREAELENSPLIHAKYPILFDTARVIADPQVRNMATLAGNLAHGDPANDHPATMLALGAQVVAVGPQGERVLPIESFFVTLFTTELQHDEIVSEVRIPTPPPRSAGAYLKLERKGGRLCHRRRSRTGDPGWRRELPKSRHRSHQCWRNSGEGQQSGGIPPGKEAG